MKTHFLKWSFKDVSCYRSKRFYIFFQEVLHYDKISGYIYIYIHKDHLDIYKSSHLKVFLVKDVLKKKKKMKTKYMKTKYEKSFSNETLNFFFRKFWASYILDLAKTVWALRILSQKFTRNFVIKGFWAQENHVLVNMLLFSSHFTEVH